MKATNKIIMVRPNNFYFNEETAKDNFYQNKPKENKKEISKKALKEFDQVVKILKNKNIQVNILKDNFPPYTPDSIFPNNWFSTHNGKLIFYLMYAENRRLEIDKFKNQLIEIYRPNKIIDLRKNNIEEGKYLESTGAMVFDRANKKIYSSLSERADETLIKKISKILSYEPIIFKSEQFGNPIYHTNVMFSLTKYLAFISLDLIKEKYRNKVYESLKKDKEIIDLSPDNILNFCGNMIELSSNNISYILMSDTAYRSFSKKTLDKIRTKYEILHFDVSTIENVGGGSIRCMIGELF